ncbi:Tetrapyrrole biosynthesis, glutamyl-tRNA reductase [Syntrophomonas zehnderi OL-4]|uniref:Glutamyl-tRNA reductase n=1 Tax=Syntrophomonas zehnderi OL-4 TaxID=690567 RepID=A0A0E4GDF5_9FIRM|nr:glutamyl-tRNA reductase [Syntrophomonas zehnderi]CFX46582.1 Tetrapyrrole biosynthesis, glutamyl-tRNA reductase [Syntrophomonas zehnderi OL-4]
MYVLLAGISHHTASVEIREKFALTDLKMKNSYCQFKKYEVIEGIVIINTCNRTELYASARNIVEGQEVLKSFMMEYSGISEEEFWQYCYLQTCYEAIAHLFRVTSGLDSMILGETQILGQVKDAYQKAQEFNALDKVLNALFQKALFVGKKVRTDTRIDQHLVSVSGAAVDLAQNRFGDLQDKTVLVVGAGETGELTTRHLMLNGVNSVIVSNRSYRKAEQMAALFNGKAVRFDEMEYELQNADIVISCTAANHCVIREDNCGDILRKRKGFPILFIDIAVPRDVEVSLNEIEGVYIYDIDDLQDIVNASYHQRCRASWMAETIIEEELTEFKKWLETLYVVPIITALKKYGETIKQNELKRAFNRLGKVSEREQVILQSLAASIVNQLLRSPIVKLKEMAASNEVQLYPQMVMELFALNLNEEKEKDYTNFEVGKPG